MRPKPLLCLSMKSCCPSGSRIVSAVSARARRSWASAKAAPLVLRLASLAVRLWSVFTNREIVCSGSGSSESESESKSKKLLGAEVVL